MGSTPQERMRAFRRRKKIAGCKSATLWLDPTLQEQIGQLRRAGETLEDVFRRGLSAIKEAGPLQGKILLLQTEYIQPLREEVAKLQKRLGTAEKNGKDKPAAPTAQVISPLPALQARHQALEQALRRLQQEVQALRAGLAQSPSPADAFLAQPAGGPSSAALKSKARSLYRQGMSPAKIWDSLAEAGTPPGSRGNMLRYIAPDFADQVMHVAAALPLAFRSGNRVAIAQVWKAIQAQARRHDPALDYAGFKRRLEEAQQAGRLRLLPAEGAGSNGGGWRFVCLSDQESGPA